MINATLRFLTALFGLVIFCSNAAAQVEHSGLLRLPLPTGDYSLPLHGRIDTQAPVKYIETAALDGHPVGLSIVGGGPECTIATASWDAVPETALEMLPAGASVASLGWLTFELERCSGGAAVDIEINISGSMPSGAQAWKFAPGLSGQSEWKLLQVVAHDQRLRYTVVDGADGDSDSLENGAISGPIALLVVGPTAGGSHPAIPTLSTFAIVGLVALMLVGLRFAAPRREAFKAVAVLTIVLIGGIASQYTHADIQGNARRGPTGAASVKVSPSLLHFRVDAAGDTSSSQAVELHNATASAIALGAFSIDGPFQQVNDCPAVLGSGMRCAIHVTYHPPGDVAPGAFDGPILAYAQPQSLVANGAQQGIVLSGTRLGKVANVEFNGQVIAPSTIAAEAVSAEVPGSWLMESGSAIVRVRTTDGAWSNPIVLNLRAQSLPPDPASIAPSFEEGTLPAFVEQIRFLYNGPARVQIGVVAGTIDPRLAAVIRGQVTTRAGAALAGVTVSVHGHPEFGATESRESGEFDLVVNAGTHLVLDYNLPGYLPAQRQVVPMASMFAHAPDVALIPFDTAVTRVDATLGQYQLALASTINDAAGTRRAALLFRPGTTATLMTSQGQGPTLSSYHVRATEYTVGANGQQAMPADLPEGVAYTYAVEHSIDEAIVAESAGVKFNKKVISYVENFLNFPVGTVVPVGWYDFSSTSWVASDDGRVIHVLAVANGEAVLDVDGDGVADYADKLSAMEIEPGELKALAAHYGADAKIWRVQADHFSPWDYNFPWGPPPGAALPPDSGESPRSEDNPDYCGCLIRGLSQTMEEEIPLTATDAALTYNSYLQPGYIDTSHALVQITGNISPGSLPIGITALARVSGKTYRQDFSYLPNITWSIPWDGTDAYGRPSPMAVADVQVIYSYPLVYLRPEQFANAPSWRASGSYPIGTRVDKSALLIRYVKPRVLRAPTEQPLPRSMDVGGWALKSHTQMLGGLALVRSNGTLWRPKKRDTVWWGDPVYFSITRVDPATGNWLVGDDDSVEAFEYDLNGRHVQTWNVATGVVVARYEYDAKGRVVSVTDESGNVTRIDRAASGEPQEIVAPYGQRTSLQVQGGYLTAITNPAGESHRFSYTSTGLLETHQRPGGGMWHYGYDGEGRLVAESKPDNGGWTISGWDKQSTREVTFESAEGLRTVHAFNDFGTYLETVYPDGSRSRFTRDALSTTEEQPDGSVMERLAQGTSFSSLLDGGALNLWTLTLPSGTKIQDRAGRYSGTYYVSSDDFGRRAIQWHVEREGNAVEHIWIGGKSSPTSDLMWSLSSWGATMSGKLDMYGRLSEIRNGGQVAPLKVDRDARGRVTRFYTDYNGDLRESLIDYYAAGPHAGRVASVSDPIGRSVSYDYDLAGRITSVERSTGERVVYQYDGDGRVKAVQLPHGSTHRYSYSSAGYPTSYEPPPTGLSDGSDDATTHEIDRDGRITRSILPGGDILGRSYDAEGKLRRLQAPGYAIDFSYERGIGLKRAQTSAGLATEFSYDGPRLLAAETTGVQAGRVEYGYDASDRVNEVRVNGDAGWTKTFHDGTFWPKTMGRTTLEYTDPGVPVSLETTGGGHVKSQYRYTTDFGQISEISHSYGSDVTTQWTETYQYDRVGRLVGRVQQRKRNAQVIAQWTWAYGYDDRDRLVEVKLGDVVVGRYAYDANGNRVEETILSGTQSATHDAQDRLQQCGARQMRYDAAGRRIEATCAGRTTRYVYDGLGQLVEVQLPDGKRIGYMYDGLGRRVGRTRDGVYTGGWLYEDGLRIAAQLDAQHEVVARYGYGLSPNAAELMLKGGREYRLLKDHLGSTREVVDVETGEVVQALEYDEWGEVLRDSAPGYQAFGYAGGLYDEETALVRFGARDYDARDGTWLTKDPIGLNGGDNLYAYVGGNPISLVDPTGNVVIAPVVVWGFPIVAGAAWAALNPGALQALSQGWDALVTWVKPPENAYDPNGPKAPGKPTEADGFTSPKGGDNWVPNPNGKGWGWEDSKGDVWCPTGQGGSAHGGPHWDVQTPGGGYRNVRPKR